MYDIPYFKAADEEQVIAYMHAHPFITLCGCNLQGIPVATHVPVLIETRQNQLYLLAHIMREQAHTKAFEENLNVLAVFSGAHTYVSASWYKHQAVASTWNYEAVHAQGKLRFTGEAALYDLLVKLTAMYEQPGSPALVAHMKPGYVQSLMQHIVAFEIEITNLQHVFKLSQNRDTASYKHIIQHLQHGSEDGKAIAARMEENKDNAFTKLS